MHFSKNGLFLFYYLHSIDIEVENSDCLNVIDKVPSIDSSMSKIIKIIKKSDVFIISYGVLNSRVSTTYVQPVQTFDSSDLSFINRFSFDNIFLTADQLNKK